MPLYEYRCEKGHVTERVQKAPTGCIRCPECGRDAPRIPTAANVPRSGTYSFH